MRYRERKAFEAAQDQQVGMALTSLVTNFVQQVFSLFFSSILSRILVPFGIQF